MSMSEPIKSLNAVSQQLPPNTQDAEKSKPNMPNSIFTNAANTNNDDVVSVGEQLEFIKSKLKNVEENVIRDLASKDLDANDEKTEKVLNVMYEEAKEISDKNEESAQQKNIEE